jgi:hypothetical protein
MPIAKCIVTKRACSFSTITAPPKAIWLSTSPAAITAASFIPFLEDFDFNAKTIVVITSNPVVAANVLCMYSIKNSSIGTNPAGQRGQSGHERPTPEALTYPPKKIRVKRQARVPKERYRRKFIFS